MGCALSARAEGGARCEDSGRPFCRPAAGEHARRRGRAYELATAIHRDKHVTDAVYKAAVDKFGERGVMDIIGIIGYYGLVSMALISAQVGAPADSTAPPLSALQ